MTAPLQAKPLNPGITCNDLQRSLQFYTEGLGFEVVRKGDKDGKLQFAMLKAGDALMGIGQDDFAKGRDRVKGVGVRFWINTAQDVTTVADRVKAAGFTLDSEPAPLPWGPMGFTLKDPDGYLITVSHEA